ncbi:MAG: DUF2905 domain-containing protein [Anaerolineae bacterium]|nr:DUF2905 domain-containing protein [Anaerolineae bacterium]
MQPLSHQQVGLWIIVIGAVAVIAGLVIWAGGFSWFGHLPGDIHIERENVKVYIPWVSMLLVSLILNLLLWLVRRLLR